MPFPYGVKQKLVERFDQVITHGDAVFKMPILSPERFQEFVRWKTNCASLLEQVLPPAHSHRKHIQTFNEMNRNDQIGWGVAAMRALKEDFEKGMLGDLHAQIEAEIAADYMGQAEELLNEGHSGKYDHVPAAVLAGAVLEKALRTICGQQQPAISTVKPTGEPKTANPLIDDLKKAGAFNEAKAKQLRAWADIRNHAAHGQFDQFTRGDVENMIPGINNFLGDYLK